MKNQIILMAAAALAFASCSKDEMTEVNPGNAISFRTAVTRSADVATGNLQKIFVSALYSTSSDVSTVISSGKPYFHKVTFTKNGTDGVTWTADKTYYWPTAGYLTFVAWAPESINSLIADIDSQDDRLPSTLTFTPNSDVASQEDFIGAISAPTQAPHTGAVDLTFHHELSNIIINAKNTNSAYTYQVAGVRFGHVYDRGIFTLAKATTENAWTYDGAQDTNYTIEYAEHPVTLDTNAKSIMDGDGQSVYKSAKLIPQTRKAWDPAGNPTNGENVTDHPAGSYISVKVKITTAGGAKVFPKNADDYGWVSVPVAIKWVKNNQYTYVLDFSNGAGYVDPSTDTATGSNPGDKVLGNAITFTVTETGWVAGNGQDGADLPMTPQQN